MFGFINFNQSGKSKPKIMKNIAIILFLFTSVSCGLLFQEKENEYYSLPLENKSNLQQNAVLIYSSSKGETDTLYCVLKIEGTYRQALGGSDGKDPSAKWEFQAFYFCHTNDSSYIQQTGLAQYLNYNPVTFGDGTMYGGIPQYGEYIRLTIGYTDMPRDSVRDFSPKVDWYGINNSLFDTNDVIDSVEINHKTYKNVYDYVTISEGDLVRLYVNKDYGILEYKLKNGVTWSLQ